MSTDVSVEGGIGTQETCEFVPESFETKEDPGDGDLLICDPSDDCEAFECDMCGLALAFGEEGWFEREYPYRPRMLHWCPNCGAKVNYPFSWLRNCKGAKDDDNDC